LIKAAQEFVRAELAMKNKLHLQPGSLEILRKIPKGSGVILTPNHADETDPRICLELSRQSGKRLISMCNREAFDEMFGLAGWTLQRLGHFSVERGAHDKSAKDYAVDVVKQGEDVLVVFPEGEIFYLNEVVQPFHSGAVEICMQAIVERRKQDPDWSAYIVPMAIKYHYPTPIEQILEERIAKMEAQLKLAKENDQSLAARVMRLQKTLLTGEEKTYNVVFDQETQQDLFHEIESTENIILSEVAKKHNEAVSPSHVIDDAWRLEAEIRESLQHEKDPVIRGELKGQLAALNEVAHMSSWRPPYYQTASADRLAEALLKVEREFYKIKRPQQLASRDVFVTISEPIDLGAYADDYQKDSRSVRHSVTSQLHELIQHLVDSLVNFCSQRKTNG
jgi:1-acyl-sn-glycerol-3-phosphate acyltransferase